MSKPPSPSWADESAVRLDPEDPYLRIQSVTIFVRDVDQSLHFYVDQLGFAMVFDGRSRSGRRFVTVAPPDGTANLTLVTPDPDSEEYKLIGRPTPVAFVTEDVVAKFREWRKRGVRFQFAPRLKRLQYKVRVVPPPSMQAAPRSSGQALGASPDGRQGAGVASELTANAPSIQRAEPVPIWGGVFTRFKDLDGNSFLLVSFDEVSREIEAHRRATAERVEAERRAAQELEIAKQVQARLFPQTLPPIQTLEYAGICIQARPVGGDYYDFLDLGRERVGLVVGDISGKGIAAALLMANLQANLRSQCAVAWDQPQRFLRSANQLFYENTADSAYATLFFGEYDDQARRLRYVSCGHLSALLLRSDNTLERLESTCTVLGLFREWDCAIEERLLLAGDTLLLYTDGITESFNQRGEEFGEQRLIEVLCRHRGLSAQALLGSVVGEVQQFSSHEQHDDITLIVAKGRGN
jgi:serine phosphatase RsbU (regulator of sigma subunit)